MKKLLVVYLVIISSACIHKKRSNIPDIQNDTALPALDTAISPHYEVNPIADSLQRKHLMDSFYAIKPIAIFWPDENGNAYGK